jgi:CRP/FNR family transcriptional regulator
MIPLEKIIVLSQVPLFSMLKTEELNTISTIATETSYEDGHTLDDIGDKLFIVVSGEVMIHKKDKPIATVKENDFVGELSLFNAGTHITSARCSGKCTFLTIKHKDMERLIHEYPAIALGFIKALISRMRDMIESQE